MRAQSTGFSHRIFGTTDTAARLQSPSARTGCPRPTKRSPRPRGTNPGMHLNWIAYTRRIGRLNVVSGGRLRIYERYRNLTWLMPTFAVKLSLEVLALAHRRRGTWA